jgi:hypothetical protein
VLQRIAVPHRRPALGFAGLPTTRGARSGWKSAASK